MAEKKKGKVIEMPQPPDPREKPIEIPTRIVEALLVAIDGGNWISAVNVANEWRAIAEEQHPTYFKK